MDKHEISKEILSQCCARGLNISHSKIKSLSCKLEGHPREKVLREVSSIVISKKKNKSGFSEAKSEIYKFIQKERFSLNSKRVRRIAKQLARRKLSPVELKKEVERVFGNFKKESQKEKILTEEEKIQILQRWLRKNKKTKFQK